MNDELIRALSDICSEKDIDKEVIFEALEAAMVAAYKKNFDSAQN
ncbi:MAG: transcription termination/antitermination protein NusA, partial [Oscillospiraceae bacterium]|nr:transcription termination/antitermination protein NusA [Oscillospiraceae bacterium]